MKCERTKGFDGAKVEKNEDCESTMPAMSAGTKAGKQVDRGEYILT